MPKNESEAGNLSLAETLRIMDVARELREQREQARRELDVDEAKTELTEKLLAAASLTGESLTADDARAAVEHYYDSLHAYREPPFGLSMAAAHLYVRRGWLYAIAVAALVCALIWWFWGGGQ